MKKIDAEQQATNGEKNPSKISEEFLKVANIKLWSSVSKGAGVGLIVGSMACTMAWRKRPKSYKSPWIDSTNGHLRPRNLPRPEYNR